jgi:hypothetical protein
LRLHDPHGNTALLPPTIHPLADASQHEVVSWRMLAA